jgi:glycosyltransferase involved in cell wall biosynthesis
MHVLFLTQIIPYPPDAGPKVKTWHVLRYLASRGHRVSLASFVRPEEEPYVNDLREVCHDVYTVPIQRSRIRDVGYWVRSNFTGRPFLIERDDLVGMRRLIERILAEESIDIIHADQLTMTQFALPRDHEKRTPIKQAQDGNNKSKNLQPELLFDAHNAVWTIVERMRENAPWYLRPIGYLEEQRIKRYEGMVVSLYDHTLAVTEPDHLALKEAVEFFAGGHEKNKDSITVIPIAVDTEKLQPVSRKSDSKNIVTLGTLHYPPNADGIRWFAEEVFPLVNEQDPDATLTIIGKNPPPDFYQLQEKHPEAIEVTGYVQDLTPYFEQAALMVIAVRAGGGMRVRILEAFAQGMPVVTTTVGLEGIQAKLNLEKRYWLRIRLGISREL